jgi:hypothetical protein
MTFLNTYIAMIYLQCLIQYVIEETKHANFQSC